MSVSKRFEKDSEDPYNSTKNHFDEGQSSGSGILQNENRGHKRMREGDFEFTKPSGSPNEVTSLLSDDDDFLLLDPPPPPSPLEKGYGKRPTGNKPHKRKTGQSSGIAIKILNLLLDLLIFIYADEARKRKQNEDQDDSSTSKRFKMSSNNDITETGTTIEQESSSSHNASMCLCQLFP